MGVGKSKDPRSGLMLRHHVLANSYQQAVTKAVRSAGFDKRVTSHALRHCSAHCPEGTHAHHPFGATAIYALARFVPSVSRVRRERRGGKLSSVGAK